MVMLSSSVEEPEGIPNDSNVLSKNAQGFTINGGQSAVVVEQFNGVNGDESLNHGARKIYHSLMVVFHSMK